MARDKAARPPDESAEPGFEESMGELERIVEELEGGALSLDQSLAHYEKGMALAKKLTQTLEQAEKRIEKLGLADSADTDETPAEPHRRSGGGKPSEGELPF